VPKLLFKAAPAVALVALILGATADASADLTLQRARWLTKVKINSAVEIGVASDGKLGEVLVDGDGNVLYVFSPDRRTKVTCDSECQSIWPPMVAPKTGVAKAIDGARQSLIWSVRNRADGRRIVTYDGWPLYSYVTDQVPGRARGEDLDVNGGYWWVIHPNGTVEK
jgi:predicted lipoprotein with Yx(FWY)xxD motif